MKQYIPDISAVDVIDFARLDASSQTDIAEAQSAAACATGYVKNYTGLTVWVGRGSPTDGELCDELGYAVKVIAAEMIDNRQITAQYVGKNPTVMQILDMHSTNLLPSC